MARLHRTEYQRRENCIQRKIWVSAEDPCGGFRSILCIHTEKLPELRKEPPKKQRPVFETFKSPGVVPVTPVQPHHAQHIV